MKPRLPETDSLWLWVRHFLEVHLTHHRGLSPHTQVSYRTAFRQFSRFLKLLRDRRPVHLLRLALLQPPLVLEFLAWLESPAGGRVSPQTRNCRLAALRCFFHFLELFRAHEEASLWRRLCKIPFKKAGHPTTDYLEFHELEQVFAEVSLDEPDGFRDLTLLAVLYNTGARASEVTAMRRIGLVLGQLPSVRLLCKGRRERICPLWPSTASLLSQYLEHHRRHPHGPQAQPLVFINQRGGGLTRFGLGRIVSKYVGRAATSLPSLRSKTLSTHSFRHTTAIHLLESGADVNVIKAWLGHRSVLSTGRYLDLNLENHRHLLERLHVPARLLAWQLPEDPAPDSKAGATPPKAITTWLKQL